MDWDAMVATLELDGTLALPLVDQIVDGLSGSVDWASITGVLDVGCGPGVIATALAAHAPRAEVIALDGNAALLERVAARAAGDGLADRVRVVEAQLDEPLPHLPDVDVIWASMVLHHVARPTAVLTDLRRLLRGGGVIVLTEFAGPPQVLPAGDPATGAWERLQHAVAEARAHHLGLDPVAVDWPPLLHQAGFVDITDDVVVALHPAPLGDVTRTWLAGHLARNLEWVTDHVAADDIDELRALADSVPDRDDLFVRIERRVLTATAER
jgi:ubiquinone/menaquinone biosynthesis C-methylase UbiE